MIIAAVTTVVITILGCFLAPKIKEKLEVSSDLRKAVLNGRNVKYHNSTLRHIKKRDRELKGDFRVLTHKISMLGEFWSPVALDALGFNLECCRDFDMYMSLFEEVLNSKCPYEECKEAMKFLHNFENNFFDALIAQIKADEEARSYEPYSWVGDFLPEVAVTEE